MIANIETLQQFSGLKRRSDVCKWLKSNGISYMTQPSGDPVTTLDAINQALFGKNATFSQPNWSDPPCHSNSRKKSLSKTAATTTTVIRKSGTV